MSQTCSAIMQSTNDILVMKFFLVTVIIKLLNISLISTLQIFAREKVDRNCEDSRRLDKKVAQQVYLKVEENMCVVCVV